MYAIMQAKGDREARTMGWFSKKQPTQPRCVENPEMTENIKMVQSARVQRDLWRYFQEHQINLEVAVEAMAWLAGYVQEHGLQTSGAQAMDDPLRRELTAQLHRVVDEGMAVARYERRIPYAGARSGAWAASSGESVATAIG
jgi:hypothetical protein